MKLDVGGAIQRNGNTNRNDKTIATITSLTTQDNNRSSKCLRRLRLGTDH